jgi:hypothetical protein
VKILWAHANEATENNALQQLKPVYEPGEAVPLLQNMPFVGTISGPPAGIPANVRPAASPEELVERAIDWMEEQGQALEPWQAQAFRAIMLSRRP